MNCNYCYNSFKSLLFYNNYSSTLSTVILLTMTKNLEKTVLKETIIVFICPKSPKIKYLHFYLDLYRIQSY
jgi:hypothetical protein